MILGLLLLPWVQGCGTTQHIQECAQDSRPHYYSGTKWDSQCAGSLFNDYGEVQSGAWLGATFGFLDFPFSVVGDTLILPYDFYADCQPKPVATNPPYSGK